MDYYQTFVKYILNGRKYTAIMLRNERLHKAFVTSNITENICLKYISSDNDKAKALGQASTTILFSDSGNHGSGSLHTNKSKVSTFTEHVVQSIKPLHSSDELDIILEKITKSKDSLLIALLQSQRSSPGGRRLLSNDDFKQVYGNQWRNRQLLLQKWLMSLYQFF